MLAVAVGAATWLGLGRGGDVATGATDQGAPGAPHELAGSSAPPPLFASAFCVDAGYLCAGLSDADSIRLMRWRDHDGTLVVHVPVPENESSDVARALQRAATQGIRAWNNQPFPILVDLRGDQSPHFSVRWVPALGGRQIGVARTTWSSSQGLGVLTIELATRAPGRPGASADPDQVRLTAAHEMGHALGLTHSDQPRDVMYPENTATSMSARDYRTVEVLYATPDGTVVRRD